jgi:hypothetical protein
MTKRALAALVLVALAVPLYADFGGMEHALTARLGRPTYIPLLGLVRFATWFVRPEGVHDFQLVMYEGPRRGVDAAEIQRAVEREIPRGFSPLVRARERNGEWTLIYAKAKGESRLELVIVAHDHGDGDTTLIRVDVDAERVAKNMGDAHGIMKIAKR